MRNPLIGRVSGVAVAVLACAACVALLYVTAAGIGLRSDSAVYVAAARNLVDGHGLSWISGGGEIRPMTLHAPLLPILLAGAEALGANAIPVARVLNAICLGLDVLLVGAIAFDLTRSHWLAVLSALVVAGTGELYRVHVWLMSEPLFITWMLLGVWALWPYRRTRTGWWLALASASLGLAGLARYGGVALPAAAILVLLLDTVVTWRRKLRDSLVIVALGLAPTAIWMFRNYALTGQMGGRSFGDHLDLWPSLRDQALRIIMNWYAPQRLVEWVVAKPGASALLVFLLASALVVGLLFLTQRARRTLAGSPSLSGVVLLGACALSYLAIVFIAALFSTPGADVDERVLSPAYPLLWLVLVAILGWLWSRGRLVGRLVLALLLVFLVRNKLTYTYWTLRELSAEALGYASRAWQSSPTIRQIREMDPGVIYTNDTAAVYLLADRVSYVVPWGLPDYDPQTASKMEADVMRVLIEHDGALVLFGGSTLPEGWSGGRFLKAFEGSDGVILLAAGQGSG